jgi:hypothetical protein
MRELLASHKDLARRIEQVEEAQERTARTQQQHASILVQVVQEEPAANPCHRFSDTAQPQEEVTPRSGSDLFVFHFRLEARQPALRRLALR